MLLIDLNEIIDLKSMKCINFICTSENILFMITLKMGLPIDAMKNAIITHLINDYNGMI